MDSITKGVESLKRLADPEYKFSRKAIDEIASASWGSYGDMGPIYEIRPHEQRSGEIFYLKLAIKLNLGPGKEPRRKDLASSYSFGSNDKYFMPYRSNFFDGVMIVSNHRIIFRFNEQYKEHDNEVSLGKANLSLKRTENLGLLYSRKFKLDVNTEPFLHEESTNLDFWLENSEPGSRKLHSYYYQSFSAYKAFLEAIRYLKSNSNASADDPELSSIIKRVYRADSKVTKMTLFSVAGIRKLWLKDQK